MTTLRQGYAPAYPDGPLRPVTMRVADDGTETPSGVGRLVGDNIADPDGPFASVAVHPGPPRSPWRKRWQWRVTDFDLVQGNYAGVFDRWSHLGSIGGHAATRWGAYLAAGRYLVANHPDGDASKELFRWQLLRPWRIVKGWAGAWR